MKNIKKILFCILTTNIVFAQDQIELKKSSFNIDYAIPDLPAFKAIGFEPSDILRPSSPKAFSVLLPQFYNNKQVNLPKSLAVEIAPFQLFNSNKIITLDEYLKKKVVNSLRISIGINADSTEKEPKARKLGIGIRMTFIDKGNFEESRSFLAKDGELLRRGLLEEDMIEKLFKISKNLRLSDDIPDSLTAEYKKYLEPKRKFFYASALEELRKNYKEKYWNAEKLDVALALSNRSKDDMIKNFKNNKVVMWVTYAYPLKSWGQILFGYSGAYNNNIPVNETQKEVSYWQNSFSSRAYSGTNKLKAYLEAQYKTKELNISNSFLAILGGEYNIIEKYGIWLNFYVGIKKNSSANDSQFVSNLDLKFSLPENK